MENLFHVVDVYTPSHLTLAVFIFLSAEVVILEAKQLDVLNRHVLNRKIKRFDNCTLMLHSIISLLDGVAFKY